MNCIYCGKPIESPRKEYCSKECSNKKWRLNNKDHIKTVQKQYYETNRTIILAKDRTRRSGNPEFISQEIEKRRNQRTIYDKIYSQAHKKERWAHHKLEESITMGKIVRPNKCQLCGFICTPHGHHKDYEKPLGVIWLCPSCHRNEHEGRILQTATISQDSDNENRGTVLT
jgi:hypothetical protein